MSKNPSSGRNQQKAGSVGGMGGVGTGGAMNKRVERIASTLREAVQQVVARGLADPRARGLITITSVRVSDDLKTADIFVSVLPEKHQDLTMHAIRHAARHIRRESGELMALRELPQFNFLLDTSLKEQAAVFDALLKVRQEAEQRAGAEPNLPPPSSPGQAEKEAQP